jgi:hypothetical protein
VSALADATVVLHLAFVVFVLAGGLLVARWPRLAWVHLPSVAWVVWVEFAGWYCPLTPLENWFREQSGGGGVYSTSFVEQYILPLLYPAVLTREIQYVLGGFVLALNIGAYAWVKTRQPRP